MLMSYCLYSLFQAEAPQMTTKVIFGWLHFSFTKHRYCQVRCRRGETGGTFEIVLNVGDDYDTFVANDASLFFHVVKTK